jgi:hypothetical protein
MIHNEECPRSGKWYKFQECREFSTDGTSMGAFIAHSFGTTDEDEIVRIGEEEEREERQQALTGMDEEQADWEEGGGEEIISPRPSEPVTFPIHVANCGCWFCAG